jgi:hypothetical protein
MVGAIIPMVKQVYIQNMPVFNEMIISSLLKGAFPHMHVYGSK